MGFATVPLDVNKAISPRTLQALLQQKCETESLDYKESIDLSDRRAIVELARDVLALANTRGGHIVIGVEDGEFSLVGLGHDLVEQFRDSNRVYDILSKYTANHVSLTTAVHEIPSEDGCLLHIAVLFVPRSKGQIPAAADGSYPDPTDSRRQLHSFRCGDVIVRKGASSRKVASPYDLRNSAVTQVPETLPRNTASWANPYDFNRAATGALFKGRRKEIQALLGHLEAGTHVAVFGLQRMGKTSLVREALRNRISTSSRFAGGFTFAEIELHNLGSDRLTYKTLLEAILDRLITANHGAKQADIALNIEQFASERGGYQRGRSDALLYAYKRAIELLVISSEKPIILFLDEFSELCRKIEANERKLDERSSRILKEHPNEMLADVALMRFISSLLKSDSLKKKLTVILAVRPFVSEFDRTRDLQILKLTAPIPLYHLDEAAAKALIQEPLEGKLHVEPNAVDYLYRVTDGHPYLIQYMLNEVVSELQSCPSSRINIASVRELEERMIQDSSYDAQFEVLDSDYSVDEALYGKKANLGRGVLALIAKRGHVSKEGWVAEDEVLRAAGLQGLTPELTAEILDQLHRAHIIQERDCEEQMQYRVAISLLRKRYVRQNFYLKYFTGIGRAVIIR